MFFFHKISPDGHENKPINKLNNCILTFHKAHRVQRIIQDMTQAVHIHIRTMANAVWHEFEIETNHLLT